VKVDAAKVGSAKLEAIYSTTTHEHRERKFKNQKEKKISLDHWSMS